MLGKTHCFTESTHSGINLTPPFPTHTPSQTHAESCLIKHLDIKSTQKRTVSKVMSEQRLNIEEQQQRIWDEQKGAPRRQMTADHSGTKTANQGKERSFSLTGVSWLGSGVACEHG